MAILEFKLTRESFASDEYTEALMTLFETATQPSAFKQAADKLLAYTVKEFKLGVYHGDYKALPILMSLFYCACAKTKTPLQQRQQWLEQQLKNAETKQDDYRLVALLKVLGAAANVFDAGEYDYHEDPDFDAYIAFTIEKLAKYAGLDDESGCGATAEDELHELLNLTIDEPYIWGATDIPFRIFRAYLDAGREWNMDPCFHIKKIDESIAAMQDDSDEEDDSLTTEMIAALMHRREQLASLFGDRAFIASDVSLYRGAKKLAKWCIIDDVPDPNTNLRLHQRQSLAERLIYSGTTNLHRIARSWPKATYVIATFGMAVSNEPHQKGGTHKRQFYTVPIAIPDYTISGRNAGGDGHAEESLYAHLLKPKTLQLLLKAWRDKHEFARKGHKVYALVLDLHGTYDMCMSCSERSHTFQQAFRRDFSNILVTSGFKVLTKYPSQLPVIIRYTSDKKYDYAGSTPLVKQGTLVRTEKRGASRLLRPHLVPGLTTEQREMLTLPATVDIQDYGCDLLVHGSRQWHSFWNASRQRELTGTVLPLETWTAHTTNYQYRQLSDERKRRSYLQGGGCVETHDLATDDLDIGGLKFK